MAHSKNQHKVTLDSKEKEAKKLAKHLVKEQSKEAKKLEKSTRR
jgi:uncharacterized protein (DUF305 family)